MRGIAHELEDKLNRPHVFLGYSMGAILAYALTCRRLSQAASSRAPIVAAYRAPGVFGPMEDLDLDDDDALIAELARHGGIPVEILSRREWFELLIPIVRDDLRICQSYRPGADPPLPCRSMCSAVGRTPRATGIPGRVVESLPHSPSP